MWLGRRRVGRGSCSCPRAPLGEVAGHPVGDFADAVVGGEAGEDDGKVAALSFRVDGHGVQVGADVRGEVGLVDDEEVGGGDAGAALAGDVVAAGRGSPRSRRLPATSAATWISKRSCSCGVKCTVNQFCWSDGACGRPHRGHGQQRSLGDNGRSPSISGQERRDDQATEAAHHLVNPRSTPFAPSRTQDPVPKPWANPVGRDSSWDFVTAWAMSPTAGCATDRAPQDREPGRQGRGPPGVFIPQTYRLARPTGRAGR